MVQYYITGVWKDDNNVITHYAFHTYENKILSFADKKSKVAAISLLKRIGIPAKTLIWNYNDSKWKIGEDVEVADENYLRSNPNNRKTDNLGHLINYTKIC